MYRYPFILGGSLIREIVWYDMVGICLMWFGLSANGRKRNVSQLLGMLVHHHPYFQLQEIHNNALSTDMIMIS